MNRTVVTCAVVGFSLWLLSACSSEDDAGGASGGGSGGDLGGSAGAQAGSGTSGGATGTGGDAGSSTGGSSTGGSSTGGSSTGGSATGGDSTGGSATGGSATGGSPTGGAGMGGDAGAAGVGGANGGAVTAGMGGGGVGGSTAGRGGMGGGGFGNIAGNDAGAGGSNAMMNFFVTSNTSATGNIGGLTMADMRCQTLAAAVGHGNKTWRAYLSVASPMTHAINRIGEGPYYNSVGVVVAMTKAALHTRTGDPAVFLDERGNRVNGQWSGSPTPNQHDVLTGSQANGMLSTGNTCSDWTATTGNAQVGHTDGLGPSMATTGNYPIWNGSHTAPCGDLASTGGAGKLYCFVGP